MGLLGLVVNAVVFIVAGGAALFGIGGVIGAKGNLAASRTVDKAPADAATTLEGRQVVRGSAEPVGEPIEIVPGTAVLAYEMVVEERGDDGDWRPVETVRKAVPFLIEDRIRVEKGNRTDDEFDEPFALPSDQLRIEERTTASPQDVDADRLPDDVADALHGDRRLRMGWIEAGDAVTVLGYVEYDVFATDRPGGLRIDVHTNPFELTDGSVSGSGYRVRQAAISAVVGVVALGVAALGMNHVFGLGLL